MPQENVFKKTFNFLKKHWVLAVISVAIVAIFIIIFSGGKKAGPETVTVARGNISEEVSVTGNVRPVHSVDLAFEKSGRVAEVDVQIGDKVYVGETIVVLEKRDLEAQLSKAEADLASQKADLDKANVDLANYFGGISDVLNDAYAKADDAVRNQLGSLFVSGESQSPSLIFSTKDVSIDNDARNLRILATIALNQWLKDLGAINSVTSQNDLAGYIDNAMGYLTTMRSLLLKTMDAVVNASDSSLVTTYKASIDTGRTNVNTAMANLTDRKQSIASEKAAIASIQAGIKSYEASIDNIKSQILKTAIYAPISGVVTLQNAKVGEIAPAGTLITSIISASKFEVEANVAEADIAKLKVGDLAAITLDAYGNDVVFDASVSSIEPAETMVEGVATYKTKFQFTKSDDRVKSGMTANITVFTAKRENVLVIPQRIVATDKDGIKTVLVDLGNGRSEKRTIETGLKGANGNIEVVQGLSEGDRIIISNNF